MEKHEIERKMGIIENKGPSIAATVHLICVRVKIIL